MKRWLIFGIALPLAASTVFGQDAGDLALEQHSFRLYSAFWPNLHHLLWAEAWARRPASTKPSPAGTLPEPLTTANLNADENRAWEAAVSYYDREMADLDLFFEMADIRKLLITVAGELPTIGLKAKHREALADAAAVYRKHWWPDHDRANRAWIADTMSRTASLSPAVPDRLSRLYGTPWFTSSLRVDVVRVGLRQGAYTSREPAPAHITIATVCS